MRLPSEKVPQQRRRVGAQVQEAPSCNGWTFWHVETRDGRLRVLDEFRAEIAGRAG